jgi:uncharacterized protein YjbI with pentapeptide repeats
LAQAVNIFNKIMQISTKMDADEVNRRYTAGQRDFTGADLSGVKLIRAYLPGVNLWAANLTGANLARAKLWGANFDRANLTGANLSGVNLSQANLRGAKLNNVKLYGANFTGAFYDQSTRFPRGFDPISKNMRLI